MFIKYEKRFKVFLIYYYQSNSRVMSSADFNVPRYQIDYLAAKGLLDIVPYVNGDTNCRIKISDKGLTYFDEKRDKLFRFWFPTILSIVALIRPEIIQFIKFILKKLP